MKARAAPHAVKKGAKPHAHAGHRHGLHWRETRAHHETGAMSARQQLADIARMVGMLDRDRFVWAGTEYASHKREAKPGDAYPGIVENVTDMLYSSWYLRPDFGHGGSVVLMDPCLERTFAARLQKANVATTSWQDGWRILSSEPSGVRVRSPTGAEKVVRADEVRANGDDPAARVLVPSNTIGAQPGWHHIGGALGYSPGLGVTTRVYWNVSPEGAVPLVRAITRRLNDAQVPFHLKLLADPQRYTRADTGVLYLPRGRWADAAPHLEAVYDAIACYSKGPTPALTGRLARGVSVADDPGGGQSYGRHRCTLVAQGLWDACVASATEAERADFVGARFLAAGLDPDAPWLAPGSVAYSLRLREATSPLHGGPI